MPSDSTISFNATDLPDYAYNLTNGYDFTLLVDNTLKLRVISCSNGNMYLRGINDTTPDDCTDLWGSRANMTVVDGTGELMHYYNNTMSPLGVSRLRVSDEQKTPAGSVPVALVPYNTTANRYPNNASLDGVYFAIDDEDNFFYPTVCVYEDNQAPKLFLVKDPDAGVALLKSPDVEFSITGGVVSDCYTIALIQGNNKPDQWDRYDESAKTNPDILALDWHAAAPSAAS